MSTKTEKLEAAIKELITASQSAHTALSRGKRMLQSQSSVPHVLETVFENARVGLEDAVENAVKAMAGEEETGEGEK